VPSIGPNHRIRSPKGLVAATAGLSLAVGDSFASVSRTAVLANADKKFLLIDGDMRKGNLYQYVGQNRAPGLSGLINGNIDTNTAIHQTSSGNLDFISTGSVPPNPAEMFLYGNFAILMDKLSVDHDQIIIDSPPILAVIDSTIIGQVAGASFMIVKAGVHPMREIEQNVKRL